MLHRIIVSFFSLSFFVSFAYAGCDFSFDEVIPSAAPNTNFQVVVLRDENGAPEFFAQLLPMNLDAREVIKQASDSKRGICIKATQFEGVYYTYQAELL